MSKVKPISEWKGLAASIQRCRYCGHDIIRADYIEKTIFPRPLYYHIKEKRAVIVNGKMCDAIYYSTECIEKGCICDYPQPEGKKIE